MRGTHLLEPTAWAEGGQRERVRRVTGATGAAARLEPCSQRAKPARRTFSGAGSNCRKEEQEAEHDPQSLQIHRLGAALQKEKIKFKNFLEQEYESSKNYKSELKWFDGAWSRFKPGLGKVKEE